MKNQRYIQGLVLAVAMMLGTSVFAFNNPTSPYPYHKELKLYLGVLYRVEKHPDKTILKAGSKTFIIEFKKPELAAKARKLIGKQVKIIYDPGNNFVIILEDNSGNKTPA